MGEAGHLGPGSEDPEIEEFDESDFEQEPGGSSVVFDAFWIEAWLEEQAAQVSVGTVYFVNCDELNGYGFKPGASGLGYFVG